MVSNFCEAHFRAEDDIGLYYFKWIGEGFAKKVISYGPLGVGKGCGIHFAIGDLNKNGRLDIVAPGKDGLCMFNAPIPGLCCNAA